MPFRTAPPSCVHPRATAHCPPFHAALGLWPLPRPRANAPVDRTIWTSLVRLAWSSNWLRLMLAHPAPASSTTHALSGCRNGVHHALCAMPCLVAPSVARGHAPISAPPCCYRPPVLYFGHRRSLMSACLTTFSPLCAGPEEPSCTGGAHGPTSSQPSSPVSGNIGPLFQSTAVCHHQASSLPFLPHAQVVEHLRAPGKLYVSPPSIHQSHRSPVLHHLQGPFSVSLHASSIPFSFSS
jgi:hypothetical protein